MSSDNASSTVTYTSVSFNLNEPSSWGILLVNTDELPDMDSYEEVAQQGQAHLLSPAYVLDPMELDEHVPIYAPEPEHLEHHVPSDDDIQAEDQPYAEDASPTAESPGYIADSDPIEDDTNADSIDYPDEPGTNDEDETVRLKPPMSAFMKACIVEHTVTPIPSTSLTYDQAPLGHRAAMIRMRDDIPEEDMPPRRRFLITPPPPGCDVAESSTADRAPRDQYDFIDAIGAGQGLIRSSGLDVKTMLEFDRQEREIFYTQLHDARTDRRDIRLEIDVVRGQRTPYETELHEEVAVRLIMLPRCSRARAWIDYGGEPVVALHVQPARGCSYIDFMKCQPLNFKGTEGIVGLSKWIEKIESVFPISGCAVENQVKFATCTLLGAALTWWNGHVRGNDVAAYTQRFQELALMCTKFLADETVKIDKYIGRLPDNIHGNVMSARPNTLDFAIELANDLMDQKLPTYAERQNENKRKADDSSRNYHQPTRSNMQCAPKCGKCKRYGHATTDCRVNTNNNNNNNNNKNQKAGACYECGNTGHIKKNCPKLKNRRNGNGTDTTQGRAYALGGRDASPDSNVITGTFLLNNRYAMILFDTGADRSFVSNTFSALINITPTTLENHYDVELADGKIIGVNTIIRGCTLNFMNHPFNIDLMLCCHLLHGLPYRLGTSEMKRIGRQLQELSDKGFIRPSSSPWGASVLFVKNKDRSFSEELFKIAKPMTKLTQKNVKFDWGEKEEAAFQLIIQKLCSAPILALPKGSKNFIVYCDALHNGLGGGGLVTYAKREVIDMPLDN
ncbi:putative reverse transcriptase domain-containing protein [Tanacetum coccineum]